MRIGTWSFGRLTENPIFWAIIAFAGFAAWMSLPDPSDADDQPAAISTAVGSPENAVWSDPDPATSAIPATLASAAPTTVARETAPAGTVASAIATVPEAALPETRAEKSPLDGLRISAQSWRRGGLGSKALVTFTLRNANDFPVKDIEIACAFSRRDGRHLTDRKRVIGDTISMKSRKTYARMLVGFVNINANKAKCSLVTASRI